MNNLVYQPNYQLVSLIVQYPGILGTPPVLDRVFIVPPRPGPDPTPLIFVPGR